MSQTPLNYRVVTFSFIVMSLHRIGYLGLEYSYNYRIIINDFQLVASLLEEVRVPQLTTEVSRMEWRQHSSKSLDKIRCRLYLVQIATFVQFFRQATVIW